MKKLISILISLAMVFTLFAAVPAFAAPEQTGSFNVHAMDLDGDGTLEYPWAVGTSQKVYLNFEEALDTENLKITYYGMYDAISNGAEDSATKKPKVGGSYKLVAPLNTKNLEFDINGDGTLEKNSSTHPIQHYLMHEITEDKKSIRIVLIDSGKKELKWDATNHGYLWDLYVKVNDSEYRLSFATMPSSSYSTLGSKTFVDGATNVALDQSFSAIPSQNMHVYRGLRSGWVITENDNTEPSAKYLQKETANKKFNLYPPEGGWKPSTKYTVKLYLGTVWSFDQYGKRSDSYYRTLDTWSFTTEEETVPEEPEEPEEPEIPAGPVTGSFNVKAMDIDADGDIDQPYSVPLSQKIYLNFDEAVSTKSLDVTLYGKYSTATNSSTPTPNDDAKYAVDLGVNSVNFDIDGDGIVDVNDSDHKIQTYLNYELSADGKSMRIWQCDSGKEEKSWANSSYGNFWNLYVNVNGYEFRLKFVTTPPADNFAAADYGTSGTSTTIQDGMTDVALDKSFRVYNKSNVYAARGQHVRWEVTENGVATTAFNTSSSGNKTFNIEPPATGWKADTTYNVKCYVCSAWKFDQAGNRTNYDIKKAGEWNFTTGFAQEPVVTFENGVATITNNTATAVENAFLILVAKTSTGAQRILSVTSEYSLASKASETKNFALESGEAFDYFLLDSKFAPIIKEK